jgi:hypothetical protein
MDNIKRHNATRKTLLAEQQYIISFHMNLLNDCSALEEIIESFNEQGYCSADEYPSAQPFRPMVLNAPILTPTPPPFSYVPDSDIDIHYHDSQLSDALEAVMPNTHDELQARLRNLQQLNNIESSKHAGLVVALNKAHALLKEPLIETRSLKQDLAAQLSERDFLLQDYQDRLAGYLKHQRDAGTTHVESHLYEAGNQSSQSSPGTPPVEKTQTLGNQFDPLSI